MEWSRLSLSNKVATKLMQATEHLKRNQYNWRTDSLISDFNGLTFKLAYVAGGKVSVGQCTQFLYYNRN